MTSQTFPITASYYRRAAWFAIASGIIGILAYSFLITAVTTRTAVIVTRHTYLLFRSHDVHVIFQFLLMIPVAFALHKLSQQKDPGISRKMFSVGKWALSVTALLCYLEY